MSVAKNKYVVAMEAIKTVPGVVRVWIETSLDGQGNLRVFQKCECQFPDNKKREIFEVECHDPVAGFKELERALQKRLIATLKM